MIIKNSEKVIVNRYKCSKRIADWLIIEKHLSLLDYDDNDFYYFVDSQQLRDVLDDMPWYLELFDGLFS